MTIVNLIFNFVTMTKKYKFKFDPSRITNHEVATAIDEFLRQLNASSSPLIYPPDDQADDLNKKPIEISLTVKH